MQDIVLAVWLTGFFYSLVVNGWKERRERRGGGGYFAMEVLKLILCGDGGGAAIK